MTVYTALVASFSGTSNKAGQACAVLFLYLFVTFYASCIDAVSYVYCSEIFPTELRAGGMSASVATLFATTLRMFISRYRLVHLCLSNLVYTQPAPTAFANIGWKYYLIFILVPILGVPILYYIAPETKGLSLEEVAACFGDEVAMDLTHMSKEERELVDQELLNGHISATDIPRANDKHMAMAKDEQREVA